MEKSFGLFFHLKSTRNYKGIGELPIYLCIIVDKVSREISTKEKWDPAKWNGDAGRAEGKTENVRSLNSYLDLLQRKVYEARQQLLHNGHPVTAENIKTVFHRQEVKTHKYMLMEVFKKHNDQMAEVVGLEYAPGTLERFETACRHTLSFLQWKYKVEDIDISKLDYEFISEYEFWIKSVRKCNHNSLLST